MTVVEAAIARWNRAKTRVRLDQSKRAKAVAAVKAGLIDPPQSAPPPPRPQWEDTSSGTLLISTWGTNYVSTGNDTWERWWTTTSTATTGNAWQAWITTEATATTTVTYDAAFANWVELAHQNLLAPETPQQAADRQRLEAERQAEQRRWEAERAARAAERGKAEATAERLLLSLLSEEQRQTYRRERHFFVRGRLNRYRIRRGRYGNVDVIGADGRATMSLCAHVADPMVPDSDNLAVQKLMLETDDEAFLRGANRRPFTGVLPQLLPPLQ